MVITWYCELVTKIWRVLYSTVLHSQGDLEPNLEEA